jgi:hypothetical protein
MRAGLLLGWAFVLLASGTLRAADEDNAAVHYRKAGELLPKLSVAEVDVIFHPLTVPLDEKTLDLLKRCEPALEEMRRGTAAKRCDWAWDLSRKGRLKDMGDTRSNTYNLIHISCLKTRHLFEQKQHEAALEQFSDSAVLARRAGTGGPVLWFLVGGLMEAVAVDVVAVSLPQQSPATLKALNARLEALPKASPLSEALRQEKQFVLQWRRPVITPVQTPQELRAVMMKEWFMPEEEVNATMKAAGDTVTGVLKLLDDLNERTDELSKVADLSPAQFRDGLAKFEKKYPATNPLAKDHVTELQKLRYLAARSEARLAMLRAAIVLQQEGMEKFKAIKDPYGDGPFEYRPLKGGFELRSAVTPPLKGMPAAILTVGCPPSE